MKIIQTAILIMVTIVLSLNLWFARMDIADLEDQLLTIQMQMLSQAEKIESVSNLCSEQANQIASMCAACNEPDEPIEYRNELTETIIEPSEDIEIFMEDGTQINEVGPW